MTTRVVTTSRRPRGIGLYDDAAAGIDLLQQHPVDLLRTELT